LQTYPPADCSESAAASGKLIESAAVLFDAYINT